MSRYISEKLKELVAKRAGHVCEYCLVHEDDLVFGCQIDHILSIKHGGETVHENLGYSSLVDNMNKGSDLGSVLPPNNKLIRFFNPRSDKWNEHFEHADGFIKPKTKIGEVTARILQFNAPERVQRRQLLLSAGKYPGK